MAHQQVNDGNQASKANDAGSPHEPNSAASSSGAACPDDSRQAAPQQTSLATAAESEPAHKPELASLRPPPEFCMKCGLRKRPAELSREPGIIPGSSTASDGKYLSSTNKGYQSFDNPWEHTQANLHYLRNFHAEHVASQTDDAYSKILSASQKVLNRLEGPEQDPFLVSIQRERFTPTAANIRRLNSIKTDINVLEDLSVGLRKEIEKNPDMVEAALEILEQKVEPALSKLFPKKLVPKKPVSKKLVPNNLVPAELVPNSEDEEAPQAKEESEVEKKPRRKAGRRNRQKKN